MKKQTSWLKTLLSYASLCKGKMVLAVLFAIGNVIGGIIPYFGVFALLRLAIYQELSAPLLLMWCGVCLGGYALQLICYGVSTSFAHISAYTILEAIRLKIADRLIKSPLGEITGRTAGQIKDIVLDKVGTIELPLAHLIPELGSSLLLPLSMFIYIITIDWRMALAVLATLPVAMLPMLFSMKAFNEKYAAYMKANDHVNSIIVEYIEGIEVVKTFNRTAASYEKFAGAVNAFRDFTLAWFHSSWKTLTLIGAVLPSTLLATVPVGLALYLKGSLDASELTMCCILALGLVAPLIKFTAFINLGKAIEYAILSANELLEIPELPEGRGEKHPANFDITLHSVSFSYSGKAADTVLHEMDLTIPQNKVTALVGPSGGGKSTVAKLIVRFWDVSGGAIRIGGVDIRELPLAELSKLVSFVTQDNFLFNCSLKENIRVGRPGATDEEVYTAGRMAQCEPFITTLEKGWDTPAGEAGKHLSGGEKQRIAIARAILKNAPVIVLDEATAFTDPENEDKLQQSIMALSRGKTLLVIAHRLSTIQKAHQIVVLDKGRIAARGTQEELLEGCPLYQRLWEAHKGARKWAVGGKAKEEAVNV